MDMEDFDKAELMLKALGIQREATSEKESLVDDILERLGHTDRVMMNIMLMLMPVTDFVLLTLEVNALTREYMEMDGLGFEAAFNRAIDYVVEATRDSMPDPVRDIVEFAATLDPARYSYEAEIADDGVVELIVSLIKREGSEAA